VAGVKQTTHPHLVPRLETSEAVPDLPQYVFMAQGQPYLHVYANYLFNNCRIHVCVVTVFPSCPHSETFSIQCADISSQGLSHEK
jgi:hypothetical protein